MITLTIDGQKFKVKEGLTLLQVAQQNGIEIPTLCHHEAIEPYGACRLCIVEVVAKRRSRIVTSCLYPAEEGLKVKTNSPKIVENRKMLLQLLLARCSNNEIIKAMAAKMGIEQPPFKVEYLEYDDCILCGLCVRTCEQIVGVSAISLVNRGTTKWAASPFFEPAPDCIGCGSCYYICPTGAIKMEDKGDTRYIYNWKVEFKLKKCNVCGNYWAPEKQLEYIRTKWNLPDDFFNICPNCK